MGGVQHVHTLHPSGARAHPREHTTSPKRAHNLTQESTQPHPRGHTTSPRSEATLLAGCSTTSTSASSASCPAASRITCTHTRGGAEADGRGQGPTLPACPCFPCRPKSTSAHGVHAHAQATRAVHAAGSSGLPTFTTSCPPSPHPGTSTFTTSCPPSPHPAHLHHIQRRRRGRVAVCLPMGCTALGVMVKGRRAARQRRMHQLV